MKGVSFSIAVGKWARPHVGVGNYTARFCLGFVAFTFYTLDIERFMECIIDRSKINKASYDIGYREGESSKMADFICLYQEYGLEAVHKLLRRKAGEED